MPLPNALPPQDVLARLIDYDPSSGEMRWRHRPERPKWSKIYAGLPVGSRTKHGYLDVTLTYDGRRIRTSTHRIAYKLLTGLEPAMVDHRYGLSRGDTAENLRAADAVGNSQNQGGWRRKELPKNVFKCGKKFFVVVMSRGQRHEKRGFATAAEAESYARSVTAKVHAEFDAFAGISALSTPLTP